MSVTVSDLTQHLRAQRAGCLCLKATARRGNAPMIARQSQRAAERARWPELVREASGLLEGVSYEGLRAERW